MVVQEQGFFPRGPGQAGGTGQQEPDEVQQGHVQSRALGRQSPSGHPGWTCLAGSSSAGRFLGLRAARGGGTMQCPGSTEGSSIMGGMNKGMTRRLRGELAHSAQPLLDRS